MCAVWINLLCTQHLKFVTWKSVFRITNRLLFNIQVKTKITFMYEWSQKSDAREGRTIKRIKEIMFLKNGLYKFLRFSVFLSFISILKITFLPLGNFLKFYIRQKNNREWWLRLDSTILSISWGIKRDTNIGDRKIASIHGQLRHRSALL